MILSRSPVVLFCGRRIGFLKPGNLSNCGQVTTKPNVDNFRLLNRGGNFCSALGGGRRIGFMKPSNLSICGQVTTKQDVDDFRLLDPGGNFLSALGGVRTSCLSNSFGAVYSFCQPHVELFEIGRELPEVSPTYSPRPSKPSPE